MEKRITFFATNPPIYLSWSEGESEDAHPDTLAPPRLTGNGRFICAECGADITHSSCRIAVSGSHRHMMPSPYGVPNETGCFSLAPGCVARGHFAMNWGRPMEGQWCMALCSSCGNHLGWHHQTEGGDSFYLLILDHLEAAPEEDSNNG